MRSVCRAAGLLLAMGAIALLAAACSSTRRPATRSTAMPPAGATRTLQGGTVAARVPRAWHATTVGGVGSITVSAAAAPAAAAPGTGVGIASAIVTPAFLDALERTVTAPDPAVTIVAVPLADDQLAAVVCRGAPERADCASIAKTVSGATEPTAADEAAVRRALAQTATDLAAATRAFEHAPDASGRGTAARQLEEALDAEQGALQAAPVSSGARVDVLLLADAVHRLATAWGAYAGARGSGASRRTGAVARARSGLRMTRAYAAGRGLELGAALALGPPSAG